MIDPNICKYVLVNVQPATQSKYGTVRQTAKYQGHELDIHEVGYTRHEPYPVKRMRFYLKFSMMTDRYYLTKHAR